MSTQVKALKLRTSAADPSSLPLASPRTHRGPSVSYTRTDTLQPRTVNVIPNGQPLTRPIKSDGLHLPNEPSARKPKLSVTQRAAVASRVFRSNAITFATRERLAREPSYWADELLAFKHITDVWLHYDTNSDDVLNKRECTVLARDLVDRLLRKYAEMVMRDKNISMDAAMKVTLRDSVNFLPSKDVEESKTKICDRLYKELDIDHDGVITKTEFMFQWPKSCKKFLTVEQPKSMGCTIQ